MPGGAPKGNQNAAKSKPWLAALERYGKQNPEALRRIAEQVYTAAQNGESWAVTEIANRLDGKPVQPMEHSGEFTQRLKTEYTNAELALIAAGHDPDSANRETVN